jgi:hypothetical protein
MLSPRDFRPFVALLTLLVCSGGLGACDDESNTTSSTVDTTRTDARGTSSGATEPGSDESPDASSASRADTAATGGSNRPEVRGERSGTITEKPPLDVESLLTPEDLGQLVSGSYESTKLPGRKPSPTYNARRLRPGDGSDYGAGLQIWAVDDASKAKSKLDDLRKQYLNVGDPPKDKVGPFQGRSFLAQRGGIRNFGFRVSEPTRIVVVSCSVRTCESIDTLVRLAKRVEGRIQEEETGSAPKESGSSDSSNDGSE